MDPSSRNTIHSLPFNGLNPRKERKPASNLGRLLERVVQPAKRRIRGDETAVRVRVHSGRVVRGDPRRQGIKSRDGRITCPKRLNVPVFGSRGGTKIDPVSNPARR